MTINPEIPQDMWQGYMAGQKKIIENDNHLLYNTPICGIYAQLIYRRKCNLKEKSTLNINGQLSLKNMIALVIRLSIPAIMAEVSSIIMQYIDAGMVGSLGENATASIGIVSTTTWLIGGLCISAATGFSVQVAQLIGAERDEEARNVFRQGLIVALIFGAILSVTAISISKSLPVWLGGNSDIHKEASRYFFIYACALPATQLRQLCGSMLQCSGDMKTPSILNILLCVLDVIFNFIFIFPTRTVTIFGISIHIYGGNLGVAGAALGTAAAEVCVAVLMLLAACVRSKKLSFKYGGHWKIRGRCMKTAAKIAVPTAFEHMIMCGAQIVSTRIVAPLGTAAVAANSLAVTAESFCYMPGYGIGSAATTLVGQSIGMGRKDLARRFARASVILGMVIMSFGAVIMFFVAPLMFSILTPSPEVRRLGTEILRIEVFAEPLYAASIVCSGALRGAGDTLVPSILNFVSMWGIRITMALVLVPYMGLHGVWIAMCVELCIRGIMFLVRLVREKWLKNRVVVID